ncbi:MAG: DNA-binding protein [Eubacterium sp.]|nr:DNA-binding protein [Eubacterium sp.]
MEERLRKSLLYDFYGELLNEHQKQVFSAAIFDDMSYSELAEEFDISRQAAFDLVKRINNKLENYESRLGLVKRFLDARDKMEGLTKDVEELRLVLDKIDLETKEKKNISGLLNDIDSKSKEIFDNL